MTFKNRQVLLKKKSMEAPYQALRIHGVVLKLSVRP